MQKNKFKFVYPNPLQKNGINHNSPTLKDLRRVLPGLKSQASDLIGSEQNIKLHSQGSLLNNAKFTKQTLKNPLVNSKINKDQANKRSSAGEKKQSKKNTNDNHNEIKKSQNIEPKRLTDRKRSEEQIKQEIKEITEIKVSKDSIRLDQELDWPSENTFRADKNSINNDNQQLLLNQLQYAESEIGRIRSMPNLVDLSPTEKAAEVIILDEWPEINSDGMNSLDSINQWGCRHRGHEHNKLEIVCLNCFTIVCAHCIIFGNYNGQHKTHSVIPIKQFMDELIVFVKYCQSDLKNKSNNQGRNKTSCVQISKIVSQNCPMIAQQCEATTRLSETNIGKAVLAKRLEIHTKIEEMIKKILQNEQKMYQQLQKNYSEIQKGYEQEQKNKQQIRNHLRKSYHAICKLISKLSNNEISVGERIGGVNRTIEAFYSNKNQYKTNISGLMVLLGNKVQKQQDKNFIMSLSIVTDKYIEQNLHSFMKLEPPVSKIQEDANYLTPIKIKINGVEQITKSQDEIDSENQFISQFAKNSTITNHFQLNLPSSRNTGDRDPKQKSNRQFGLMKAKSVDNLHSLYKMELVNSSQFEKSTQFIETSKKKPNLLLLENFTPVKLQLQSFSQESSILLQPQTGEQAKLSKLVNQISSQLNNDKNRKKILNLSNKNLTSEQIQTVVTKILSQTNKKSIRSINLSGNKINDDGVGHLIGLNMVSCVASVNLSHTLCSEKVLDVIITNKDRLAPLRLINLKSNNIKVNENLNLKIKNLTKMGIVVCI